MAKKFFYLQAIIIIYTIASIFAKKAASVPFGSVDFFFFVSLEGVILAVYAVFWQQVIKQFSIFIAYANRAVALLWSMLWAVLFFGEKISVKNILGVGIVLLGVIIINTSDD